MIKRLWDWYIHKQVKKATEEAKSLTAGDGRKRFILLSKGRPRIFTKKQLKVLIEQKYFAKGTSMQDLEKRALFVTLNKCNNVS